MAWQTTNATASASVSRLRFEVLLRRSSRCIISCASSCASVANSSAGDCPGSSVILPPAEVPRAGAMSSEYSRAMPCSATNFARRSRYSRGSPLTLPIVGKFLAVRLADVEDVGRAKSDSR